MAKVCIPKSLAQKLKEAVKNGEISIQTLYDVTSEQRRAIFQEYVGEELAKKINAGFEKAMISKQQDALKKWAESTFKPSDKQKANYKNVLDKIDELDEMGVLNDQQSEAFLSDLVAEKLGISVTAQEIQEITERAKKLEELFGDGVGIPSIEYWVERKNMENYLNSISPASSLRVATSISGRGAMLLSVKSPVKNIISNSVNAVVQVLERRIASNTYTGLNGDFALEYVKKVNKIYQASGYDISRMETMEQNQKTLGEEITHAQGKGKIRKIGQWYEDIVFKQLMGAPDVAASSVAFADSANLASSKIARQEGLTEEKAQQRALEIFKDSILIKPQTLEGEIVRSQAITDAQYSTYTNKGGYSDFAMAIRSALNKASGDMRMGDQLMPFVKTPANVVQAGIDAAGLGFFRGFYKLYEIKQNNLWDEKEVVQDMVRTFVRSGLGMTLAVVLAFMFDPEDFVGEYDALSQKDRDLATLKNAPYNSVKIGGKWIGLDYFGPLASAFVGIMYARKYGEGLPDSAYQYVRGVGSQATKIPGLKEFKSLVDDITEVVGQDNVSDVAKGLTDQIIGYIRSRTIPAIVNDIAKATDEYERKAGSGQLSKLRSSIPGLRQTLPVKVDQTSGEKIKSEGAISTILFGSGVKTPLESKVIDEINRLTEEGASPTFSDIERSSQKVKDLHAQIGDDKFQEALEYYGAEYGKQAKTLIGGFSYKNLDDEKKKDKLNSVREKAREAMLKKFGYKAPKKP